MTQLGEDLLALPSFVPKRGPLAYSRIRAVQSHIAGDPISSTDLEASLDLEERFGIEPGMKVWLAGIGAGISHGFASMVW